MRIEFHRIFKKKYKKIPLKIRRQFDNRLLFFEKDRFNPLLKNHPLTGDRKGQYSINITGDWRAVYFLQDKNTVIFLDIDIHSNLYK
ncbi:MAG: type II toxin-antitoxin system mRNA interferase toxin, RelE/StbE family [Candidatus Pacebacteria bacterium]|nr:type II toxin-antitoxin system mRNA interferase toxin, RelE/StbE family [Candidatus Paceibacterota bacterium]